jgi:glucose-1-phosphate cytidylyltransferase
LPDYLERFEKSDKKASFLAVHSPQSFHVATIAGDGVVEGIGPLSESGHWINGGFFVFRNEFYEDLLPGEDLVSEPFQRLIRREALMAYRYEGFWRPMDTFKDKQAFDDLYETGEAPWELWKKSPSPVRRTQKTSDLPAGSQSC